jgi:protein-tyrosine phosphatase/membrane-associated phospholipid phosphatase
VNTSLAIDRAPVRLKHSLAWLALLAPLFFLSYGWANQLAASRGVTTSIVFGWEGVIPFLPWTILPYGSIDLFYGLSFLACRTPREVNHHGLRLLTAQLVSVACFVAFPLCFTGEKPATDGLFGVLFEALIHFDQPYNQAPSLHISLLVIIWWALIRHASPAWRRVWHGWASLVAISVLTTWQHHFFDLPSGLLVGLFSLWLWPDRGESPLVKVFREPVPHRGRLAGVYLLGATLCILLATRGGWALLAIWPAVALSLVAFNYARAGADGFQKRDGHQSPAVRWLLAPYRLGAWINSRLWTRRRSASHRITEKVWLGRLPTASELRQGGFDAVLDLTAEFNTPRAGKTYSVPMLDLTLPHAETLRHAARTLEQAQSDANRLLVCCALGYTRSALTLAAWLLLSGRCATVEDAVSLIKRRRPGIRLGDAHRQLLDELCHEAL